MVGGQHWGKKNKTKARSVTGNWKRLINSLPPLTVSIKQPIKKSSCFFFFPRGATEACKRKPSRSTHDLGRADKLDRK